MKVIHITTLHPRRDVRIFAKECCTLAEAGFGSTSLLVADGNGDELAGNVSIRDLGRPHGGRLARTVRSGWRAFRAVRASGADVVHFHDPEIIPVGIALKMCGHCVIYDVHEDVPRQVLEKEWIPAPLRRIVSLGMSLVEAAGASTFDAIVAATPNIARRFPPRRTVVIQNYPLIDELILPDPMPYGARPPAFTFVGVVTRQRGAREMVRALEHLPQGRAARVEIAGKFAPDTLGDELKSLPRGQDVCVHGWLARPELASLLGRSRAGLVLLHPVPNHIHAQPNKMFEYMACGLPVLASDFPLWREIIGETGCGILVDPLDPRAIGHAMQWLLEHPDEAEAMGKRGRDAVVQRFNWNSEAEHLVALYRDLALRRSRGSGA